MSSISDSSFRVPNTRSSFQITGSLAAIAAGTSFGVFTLGILFPWTNSKVNCLNVLSFVVSNAEGRCKCNG